MSKKIKNISKTLPTYNGVGIYALIDDNGKLYIGSSTKVRNRLRHHISMLFQGKHHSTMLQQYFSEGGRVSFAILEELPPTTSADDLLIKEGHYISEYDSINNGYNSMVNVGSEIRYEKKKAYNMQYDKANYKRIPLNVTHAQYDTIKASADSKGMSVNGLIKKAIDSFLGTSIFG